VQISPVDRTRAGGACRTEGVACLTEGEAPPLWCLVFRPSRGSKRCDTSATRRRLHFPGGWLFSIVSPSAHASASHTRVGVEWQAMTSHLSRVGGYRQRFDRVQSCIPYNSCCHTGSGRSRPPDARLATQLHSRASTQPPCLRLRLIVAFPCYLPMRTTPPSTNRCAPPSKLRVSSRRPVSPGTCDRGQPVCCPVPRVPPF
jgi:hypothetical protein